MGELKIGRMVLGAVGTNTYFVYDTDTMKAVVVDPADDGVGIYNALKSKGISVAGIILTHGHFDHILGASELRGATSAKIYAYEGEKDVCENASNNCSDMIGRLCTVKCNSYCKDGEIIDIEGIKCKLIATPGHTHGSCCYYFEEAGFLISGDTLFNGSVGRTDLPTGSSSQLVRSCEEKLMCLPDEVRVYPGHGDYTTIGEEKRFNPFL